MNVDVSIIVPTYYHEEYIKKALETILFQKTNFNYEIIISDDCSKDNTIKIVNEYKVKYPQIVRVYTNTTNIGICRNMYQSYMRCKGRYIVLSAGDDYWLENTKLQKQYDFLEKNNEYFSVCTSTKAVYQNGEFAGTISPKEQFRNKEFRREDFISGEIFPTSGMMFRNPFFNKENCEKFKIISSFSRDIDDFAFGMFLFDLGKIYILEDITYAILTRREDEMNGKNFNSQYKGIKNYLEHAKMLYNLDMYYEKKYSFEKWYRNIFEGLFFYIIIKGEKEYRQYFQYVPKKYWMKFVINIVFSNLKNRIRRKVCK